MLQSSSIAFAWFLHLRWGAVLAQTLLVLAVYFLLESDLPFLILFLIFGFEGISNIFFSYLSRKTANIDGLVKNRCRTMSTTQNQHVTTQHLSAQRFFAKLTNIDDRLFTAVMCLDILLMTALLHLTGGPMNPFTFLYLVHIALGSLLMQPKWAFGLAGFTVANYAALFFLPAFVSSSIPVCHLPASSGILADDPLRLHLQGMWVAFTITVFFVVFFIGKIQKALEKNQEILAALEKERINGEKLASLATLSAGAAHEFSTPLSTIAVAAGEMLHAIKKSNIQGDLYEDALLIREQVTRCKDILFQMAADAGNHLGEGLEICTLNDLLHSALSHFTERQRLQISLEIPSSAPPLYIPKRTFGRIIRGIIKNSLDASPEGSPVQVLCRLETNHLKIDIKDTGSGMTEEQRNKACEPFYTTKEPGKGMGLGLYLAKSAMERFDGHLDIVSNPDIGTTVTLTFALDRITSLQEV